MTNKASLPIPVSHPDWVEVQDEQTKYLVTLDSLRGALHRCGYGEGFRTVASGWTCSDWCEPTVDPTTEPGAIYAELCRLTVLVETDGPESVYVHSDNMSDEYPDWEGSTFEWSECDHAWHLAVAPA